MVQILVHLDGDRVPARDIAAGGVYQSKALTATLRRTLDAVRSGALNGAAPKSIAQHRRDKIGIRRGGRRISPQTRGSKIGK